MWNQNFPREGDLTEFRNAETLDGLWVANLLNVCLCIEQKSAAEGWTLESAEDISY